jgi:hypothetical protein
LFENTTHGRRRTGERQMSNSNADVTGEVAAIHARLAALADQPTADAVVEELGQIRARLRELAAENAEIGERLGEVLGLRQPPRPPLVDAAGS